MKKQATVKILSVTAIIPLSIASVLSVLLIIGIHLFHEEAYYFLPSIRIEYLYLALLYVLIAIIAGFITAKIKTEVWRLMLVFYIALLPRILIISLFREQIYPFSDFLWSWDVSQGAREGFSYVRHLPFPAYQVWSFFEFLLTKVFPDNYRTILYVNAVIDSLIAVCISKLSGLMLGDNRSSSIAGVFYSLFPSGILYCTIGTPDFSALLMNLIGIIILIGGWKNKGVRHFICVAIAGIVFGISSSFKSFSIVIILAYAIVGCMYNPYGRKKKNILCDGLILLIMFFLVKRIILIIVSSWIGADLTQYSSGVIYHQLLVGLNTEGEGQIHLGTLSRGFWNTFLNNGYNSAAAGDYARKLLIDNWATNKFKVPSLFVQKIIWAWQDDLMPIHYFLNAMGVDGGIHHTIYGVIKHISPIISQVMYAIMCISATISVATDYLYTEKNEAIHLIKLIIFGYFILLLIIEAQSRYKCLILPLLCILSARSIIKSLDGIQKRNNRSDISRK